MSAAQVAAGASHISFGDPDFFNGPTHAMHIVDALHAEHPDVSFDVTIKVEHLLQHRDLLPRLAASRCAFVTSAVESLDDRVLAFLDKGHTRADFLEAVGILPGRGPDAGADVRRVSPVAVAATIIAICSRRWPGST